MLIFLKTVNAYNEQCLKQVSDYCVCEKAFSEFKVHEHKDIKHKTYCRFKITEGNM